jgi:hypothetical protein
MRITTRKAASMVALSFGICWGCGPAGSGQTPSLLPAKGKVTYKGQPMTKGFVKFIPEGYGREARGELKSDGTFVLGTSKEGDGVVAGAHRVSVNITDSRLARDPVIKKYANPNSSKLTADVDAEHSEFTFELK